MALTFKERNANPITDKTSATTFLSGLAGQFSTFADGDMCIVLVTNDNNGASNPLTNVEFSNSTQTVKTALTRGGQVTQGSSGADGCSTSWWWKVWQTGDQSSYILLTFNTSVTTKAVQLLIFGKGAGDIWVVPEHLATNVMNSSNIGVSYGSQINSGEAAVVAAGWEGTATVNTQDSDTDGGASWTYYLQGTSGGNQYTNIQLQSEYKVLTTNAASGLNLALVLSATQDAALVFFRIKVSVSITGTLARTLANTTVAASGWTSITGTLARTLAATTCAAAGNIEIPEVTGTLAETLANATSAATGSIGISGTLAENLANTTSAATGEVRFSGTLARTLANTTSAASGEVRLSGSLAETLANTASAATGSVGISGTLAETLDATTGSAVSSIGVSGTLAKTLAATVSAASGGIKLAGTGTLLFTAATINHLGQSFDGERVSSETADGSTTNAGKTDYADGVGNYHSWTADLPSALTADWSADDLYKLTLQVASRVGTGAINKVFITRYDSTDKSTSYLEASPWIDSTGTFTLQGADWTNVNNFPNGATNRTAADRLCVHVRIMANTGGSGGMLLAIGTAADSKLEYGPTRSGTLAETLGDTVANASGTSGAEDKTGTVAVTLAATVSTAAGSSSKGDLAETLDNTASAATGEVRLTGTLAQTLAATTSTAAGSSSKADLAVTLGNVVSTAAGTTTMARR
jgi:hypothetical protein